MSHYKTCSCYNFAKIRIQAELRLCSFSNYTDITLSSFSFSYNSGQSTTHLSPWWKMDWIPKWTNPEAQSLLRDHPPLHQSNLLNLVLKWGLSFLTLVPKYSAVRITPFSLGPNKVNTMGNWCIFYLTKNVHIWKTTSPTQLGSQKEHLSPAILLPLYVYFAF